MPHAHRHHKIDVIKGIAIVAVVGLHMLSSLDGSIFTTSPYKPFFIFLNQALRLSVPLFVASSGYLLAKKYQSNPVRFIPFISKRLKSVVPLYLLWSLLISLVLNLYPPWGGPSPITINRLLFGDIDYHLYFVPMMIGLYVLFPLIHQLGKKSPITLLLATCLPQLIWYVWIENLLVTQGLSLSDHNQYLNPLSWVGYFALGYVLSSTSFTSTKNHYFLVIGVVGTLLWSTIHTLTQQNMGIDIIVAGRFTGVPVYAYAIAVIIFLLGPSGWPSILRPGVSSVMVFLGKHSYVMYLSHTLLLRIIMTAKVTPPESIRLAALSIVLLGLATSYWFNQRR
jgi:probable poly-beta-1,6-N-acetyl-D-glucosamine export protein